MLQDYIKCCDIHVHSLNETICIQEVENKIVNKKITLALNSGCGHCLGYSMKIYGIKEQIKGYFNETAKNLVNSLPSRYKMILFEKTVLTDIWIDCNIELTSSPIAEGVMNFIMKCIIIHTIVMRGAIISIDDIETMISTYNSDDINVFDYEYILDDYINICDSITGIPDNNDFTDFVERYKPLK